MSAFVKRHLGAVAFAMLVVAGVIVWWTGAGPHGPPGRGDVDWPATIMLLAAAWLVARIVHYLAADGTRLPRLFAFLAKHDDAVWPAVAFAFLITAGVIVLWTGPDCRTQPVETGFSRATTILLLLWVAWIYAWVIHCFAGDPYANRTRSIEFAYFFVILSFVAVSIMVANIGRASSFGVVEGCVVSVEDNSFLPIRCDYPARLAQVQTYQTAEPPAPAPGAPDKGAVPAKPQQKPADPPPAPATVNVVSMQPASFGQRMENAAVNHNYHHLLNIGGRLDPIDPLLGDMLLNGCPAKMIHGGVPVPVYFILLSLIGAAISLARNVPTIQRRSEEAYVGTAAEARLTPGEVRELLVFQILQFVSAPFLAVAAYHTLKPESLSTTVALGFLTGFASEKVLSLLSVRFKDLSDKTETKAAMTGQLYGVVKLVDQPAPGATVEIDGLDKAKSVKTDANGAFKFAAVPVSPQAYHLRAKLVRQDGVFAGAVDARLDAPTDVNAGIVALGQVPSA